MELCRYALSKLRWLRSLNGKVNDGDVCLLLVQMKEQNHRDDIEALEQELQVEKGSLMRHVMQKKTFRCIAFDPANAASGEVSGTNSGGYEKFVASESNNIHVFDIHTGSVKHIFDGCNSTNVDVANKRGHTGVITALYLEGEIGRAHV